MKNQSKGHNGARRRSRGRGKDLGADVIAPDTVPALSKAPTDSPAYPSDVARDIETDVEAPGAAVAAELVPARAVAGEPSTASSEPNASRRARAEQIVHDHELLAVGAGMIPVPGIDLAAIGGLQLKVLAALAEHYGVPFTRGQAQLIVTSLLGSIGTTVLAGAALVSVAKVVPFFGTLVGAASMPVAGGVVTRAFGHLAVDHFESGGTLATFDLDVAQEAFLGKIAEARQAFA